MKTIWAYGGGIQSAAIAALIVQGNLPTPDIAVIADTGREPMSTWNYLKHVVQPALDFTIHVVPHSFYGTGYNTVDLWGGKDNNTLLVPVYTSSQGNKREGMLRKYCSHEWKTRPLQRFCRERGINGGDTWIGFSTDEMERCRSYDESEKWHHVYPLIQQRMSRGDCIALVDRIGWPSPPRSACWMCPYRSDQEWSDLKTNQPAAFQNAIDFEQAIQERDPHMWVHKSVAPLDSIKFSEQGDLFAKPCASGMCFT